MHTRAILFLLPIALVGCGDKEPSPPRPATPAAPPTPTAPAPAASDHGTTVDLGKVTIADHEFAVRRLGDVVPGKEAAFEVSLVKARTAVELSSLGLYAWVEDEAGPASAPAKGTVEKGHLHFHVTPKADSKPLKRLVLRLRAGDVDARGGLPLDGHGHEHAATPHHGIVAAVKGPDGATVGHLELKLHDDKGDLELWLAKDASISDPLDLPLDAVLKVEFVDVGKRTVELRVRNRATNEDEDGKANVREGKTNYFIFPGDTGADAAWLVGPKFSSIVRVTLDVDGKRWTSEEFMLVPHTHADGEGHK